MLSSILSIGGLLSIGLLTYFCVMYISNLSFRRKAKRLSSFLGTEKKETPKQQIVLSWLEKKGLLNYINPQHIINESVKHNGSITKQSYISHFVIGTVLLFIITLVYFQALSFLFIPFSFLGGIILTNFKVYQEKKRYKNSIDEQKGEYMTLLSTSLTTYTSLKEAIQSILPSIEQPLKHDLEAVFLRLQDGKNIEASYQPFVLKYKDRYMQQFHDQLQVILEEGNQDVSPLQDIAFKMKRKEVYKRGLVRAHKSQFKVWRAFVVMTLSIPFVFLFLNTDKFVNVMSHIAATIVFLCAFAFFIFTYWKLEQLEGYDPTEDQASY